MRKQTVKLNRKTIFYSLFGLLLVLVFVKYALQTNIPEMIFLGIVAAIACFGTKDEIIAVSVACIPFHSAFSPYWAVLACIAIYILKFYRDINISRRIVAVLLLIIWELLHCFNNIFDLRLFVCDFVPYLLCVLLMWCDASKFDYKFIVRSFAVAVLSTGAMLVGKIGFRVGFRLESILLNLQRLGLDSEEMEIAGAEINPNTFGILCVLAACGLFQILMTEEKKFSDILLIIALFTIGSFTISKTFLILTSL